MKSSDPRAGMAFSMPTAVGHIVGIATHEVPRIGTLVWIALPTFDHVPMLSEATSIVDWRWPTLFPLPTAFRRKSVFRIGMVSIPAQLRDVPMMRGGGGPIGWVAFKGLGDEQRLLGRTEDRSLPIYEIANDVALREKIESGWEPQDYC